MFTSLRSGTAALYRRLADATGSDQLVFRSTNDINEGAMSPDGKYLVLRTGGYSALSGTRDITMARIAIDTIAKPMIATPYDEEAFAISPDGRHFIMARRLTSEPAATAPVVTLENWFAELQAKVKQP
jgi:Tol biopolymer transport system component